MILVTRNLKTVLSPGFVYISYPQISHHIHFTSHFVVQDVVNQNGEQPSFRQDSTMGPSKIIAKGDRDDPEGA